MDVHEALKVADEATEREDNTVEAMRVLVEEVRRLRREVGHLKMRHTLRNLAAAEADRERGGA